LIWRGKVYKDSTQIISILEGENRDMKYQLDLLKKLIHRLRKRIKDEKR